MSLTMVNIGEQKIIKEIRAKESVKRHLQNLGFIAGEKIEVISENNSGIILMIKGSKIALNKGMANKNYSSIVAQFNWEEMFMSKTLKDLKPGQKGVVLNLGKKGPVRKRLMDMGITPGVDVEVVKVAPLGDPIEVNLRGYELSLRKDEAEHINLK